MAQLHLWTDTFAALAFLASCVYGYEFFRRKCKIANYEGASRFIVALALFPVFWLAFVGVKHAILAYNPSIYYLGNIMFGLVALLVMYVGLRHLPMPKSEVRSSEVTQSPLFSNNRQNCMRITNTCS